MVVSGRKLGLLPALGLFLVALLVAACTSTPSTTTTTTTLQASTSTSTSVSTTSTSVETAATTGETHRVIVRFRSIEPRLALYWEGFGSGDFPTDTAQTVTLQLGFTPSGSLDSLFIVAYVLGTKQLLTAEAFGPPSEYIDISGAVVDGVSIEVDSETVVSYLAAIERVGRETMLAQLPVLPEPSFGTDPGYYLLEAWPKAGGAPDIPTDVKAFVWDGSAFQPLDAGDPRRQADPEYVRMAIRPIPSAFIGPGPPPGSQTTTTVDIDTSPVFFVIPVGTDTAEEGATTIINVTGNVGAAHDFFWGLKGDGYVAYKLYDAQEGDARVKIVGVRVDIEKKTQATYEAIYTHATTLAKEYDLWTESGWLFRVVLVEATDEQKIIESRDFDLTGGWEREPERIR